MTSRIALGALVLLNVALVAFAIQLAAGKVPIPETWAWAVPILSAVVTAATTLLPRAGSEGLAAQVDALKSHGVDRRNMVVVPADEAIRQPHGASPAPPDGMSDEDIGRLADRLFAMREARIRTIPTDPGLVTRPPEWIAGGRG